MIESLRRSTRFDVITEPREHLCAERFARTRESLLHGVLPQSKKPGDLLHRTPLAVVERDRLARVVGEGVERFGERGGPLVFEERFARVGARVGDDFERCVVERAAAIRTSRPSRGVERAVPLRSEPRSRQAARKTSCATSSLTATLRTVESEIEETRPR
jgi:hypothetical protein